jgi:hypothetical protein
VAQTPPADSATEVRNLYQAERWDEILERVKQPSPVSAEINYYYGIAAAQRGQWAQARAAFLAGRLLEPRDPRFPIELGGVDFREKRYARAARWVRRGLELKPDDAYANEFLATIYFLNENLEAALKYWNRVGKPRIVGVRKAPELQVNPVLLDRAFAFAPASVLELPDLLTTDARLEGLGIFPSHDFELVAREDNNYDLTFAARERNGWGRNVWEGLASTFRGIFYETIYPEYYNARGAATNLKALYRWDSQKRRLQGSVSSPLRGNPRFRFQFGADLFNENWDLRELPPNSGGLLAALNIRRQAVSAGFASFSSGQWTWSTGAEFSHRDYRNVLAGAAFAQPLLMSGYQLKHLAELNFQLWRVPERRFTSSAHISSEIGTIWSGGGRTFEKLQAGIAGRWLPQMSGDDYATMVELQAGRAFGPVPFDELFVLGLERENPLRLRAHVSTRDGRKGNAPMGRNYVLLNSEIDKNIYDWGLVGIKLSPFLDIGRSTDPMAGLGSKKLLWDTGLQLKVRFVGIGFVVVYGRDLRTGKDIAYFTAER